MNVHASVTNLTEAEMSGAGEVLIPKVIRDRIGLVPGKGVQVGINDRGEAVIFPAAKSRRSGETPEQRAARIRAAIESVRGSVDLGGMTTDEYMAEIRGPYPDDL